MVNFVDQELILPVIFAEKVILTDEMLVTHLAKKHMDTDEGFLNKKQKQKPGQIKSIKRY